MGCSIRVKMYDGTDFYSSSSISHTLSNCIFFICHEISGGDQQGVVFEKIKEGFEKIKEQPAESEKYCALDKGTSTYGVVKQLRDNDIELHTDQQVF